MGKLFGALYNPIAQLDPNANSYGQIGVAPQTWGDAVQDGVRNVYTALGASQGTANRHAQAVGDLIGYTPYQSVMDIADYAQGNGSALNASFSSLDIMPGLSSVKGILARVMDDKGRQELLDRLNKLNEGDKRIGFTPTHLGRLSDEQFEEAGKYGAPSSKVMIFPDEIKHIHSSRIKKDGFSPDEVALFIEEAMHHKSKVEGTAEGYKLRNPSAHYGDDAIEYYPELFFHEKKPRNFGIKTVIPKGHGGRK